MSNEIDPALWLIPVFMILWLLTPLIVGIVCTYLCARATRKGK